MGSSGETCAFPGCDRESEQDGAYCPSCSSETTESGAGGEVTEAQPTAGGGEARATDRFVSALKYGVTVVLVWVGVAHAADSLGIVSTSFFALGDYSMVVSALLFGGFMFLVEWL